MSQQRTAVSEEDFKKYGPDPRNHPQFKEIFEDGKEATEQAQTFTDSDMFEEIMLAGRQCRPLTQGDIMFYERVKHPMFSESGEGALEIEQYYFAMILFIQSIPAEQIRILGHYRRNPDELEDDVYQFAEKISIADMEKLIVDIESVVSEISENIANESDSDGKAEKKTKTG